MTNEDFNPIIDWRNPPAARLSAEDKVRTLQRELTARPGDWALINEGSVFRPYYWWQAVIDDPDYEVVNAPLTPSLLGDRQTFVRYIGDRR